jgi:hypothetical protein
VAFADGAFEDGPKDAFLPPGRAGRELAFVVEAGHLGAGSGAAGRAIEGGAGAEDKVARRIFRIVGRGEELDVVDEGTFGAGNSLLLQGSVRIAVAVAISSVRLARSARRGIGDEEKPVSTPRNISGKTSVTWNIHGYV